MKYWVAWLKSLLLDVTIGKDVIGIFILCFGGLVSFREKRYVIGIWLPKYGFVLTNETTYPYDPKNYFYKRGHFHITHNIGKAITAIKPEGGGD